MSTVGMINVIDITSLNSTVAHPNGTLATITHVGNLKVSNNVVLYDVLVVPGYCVSLLSVNKLIRDIKMYVDFDEDKCKSNMVMCFNVFKLLWHNRLGRPADQVLSVLHNDLKISKVLTKSKAEKAISIFSLLLMIILELYRLPSSVLKDAEYASETYMIDFFDNQTSQRPSDDGRGTLMVDGSVPSSRHDTHTTLCQEENIATPFGDQSSSEGYNTIDNPEQTQNDSIFGQEDYGIEKHVSYANLSKLNLCFASTLNKSVEPNSYSEALKDVNWIEAMNNEIEALNRNNTWYVYDLPYGRKAIGCKWIYKIKYKASGEVERYKARLVAKGFSLREGFDYDETSSPVIKMVIVRCLISIAVVNGWPLYQLDVNNAFLNEDIVEDVYMTLPEGLKQAPRQWNAKLTAAFAEHRFEQSKFDYSLYVDDIVITGNDETEISNFKRLLSSKFMIKDLGVLKYFLGIEIIKNDSGLCMSKRKYCLELLHEYGLLAARPVDIPFPKITILSFNETKDDKYLSDFTSYQKLVGKLIYLTNTRSDISYAVHCLSQHMHSPLQSHFKAALRVLRYLKGSPVMEDLYPIELCCDNSSAIQIAANIVFHERAKHFKLDVYFVREKVLAGVIKTVKVPSNLQIADIFTKCLGVVQHCSCCRNLGMHDVFAGELVGKERERLQKSLGTSWAAGTV
ncbi:ribonuclease H-like domain-containing protein [Tanacetum coccineum]|uniref:Ribonuclease H-like domain-containing protein n=1 Tax=Tanacetum coccineum TaxID=301880 RepID=A0ABQ4YMQ1_9ASTR